MKGWTYLVAAGLVLAVVATQVRTQPAVPKNRPTPAATSTADVDPEAVAKLDRMGEYLRSLKAFQIRASTTKDDVLDDGQLIQDDAVVDLLVRRPDGLRVEVTGPRQQRMFLYNGKTFTLWAQRVNYYATAPAPPTLAKLVDHLDEKFGIQLPLEDLFYWGTEKSDIKDIKAAMDVGPSAIEGVTCQHLAFRQEGLDWQVWIQNGEYPLPRKLVLTTLTDEARPQYSSVLTWNLAPSFNEAAFEFDPPKDAQKIVFAKNNAASAEK